MERKGGSAKDALTQSRKQRPPLQLQLTFPRSRLAPRRPRRNRRLIYERSCHKLNEKSSASKIIDDPVRLPSAEEGRKDGGERRHTGKTGCR